MTKRNLQIISSFLAFLWFILGVMAARIEDHSLYLTFMYMFDAHIVINNAWMLLDNDTVQGIINNIRKKSNAPSSIHEVHANEVHTNKGTDETESSINDEERYNILKANLDDLYDILKFYTPVETFVIFAPYLWLIRNNSYKELVTKSAEDPTGSCKTFLWALPYLYNKIYIGINQIKEDNGKV